MCRPRGAPGEVDRQDGGTQALEANRTDALQGSTKEEGQLSRMNYWRNGIWALVFKKRDNKLSFELGLRALSDRPSTFLEDLKKKNF